MADKLLGTNQELSLKSNEKSSTSSTFLRSLDALAVYVTHQTTAQQKVFKKENIALAIQSNSNSFTFITKDENNLLDIETVNDEVANQGSLAQLFLPQSLLTKANSTFVHSYIYRSALLFSQPFENETVQSIILAASVPEKKISNLHNPVIIIFHDKKTNKVKKDKISTSQFLVSEINGTVEYSESSQTSNMEPFAKIFAGSKVSNVFAKSSVLDI